MLEDLPPKLKEEIKEHLAYAEYALFYIDYLLKRYIEKRKKQIAKNSIKK